MTGVPLTVSVSAGDQRSVDHWDEILSAQFTGKSICATTDEFSASMSTIDVAGMSLTRARSSGAVLTHGQEHLVASNAREFIIYCQMSGTSEVSQSGKRAILQPGDFTICDTGRRYHIAFSDPTEGLIIRFPSHDLDARIAGIEDLVACTFSSRRVSGNLFTMFVETLWHHASGGNADEIETDAQQALVCVLAMACRPSPTAPSPSSSVGHDRWAQLVSHVNSHLPDPTLNIASTAAVIGMSVRNLQLLIAQRGQTFNGLVRARRLDQARERLGRAGSRDSITRIAFDCGFNDLSYFTRRFRQRFGYPPSATEPLHSSF